MVVDERLRVLREKKNLSQRDVEKQTGLLRCYISRMENGHTVASVKTPTILTAHISFNSRPCTSESTDMRHSKTDPDVTSMKLSTPKPTSEMLPAIAPATTATRPSNAFHPIVKYSSLRPRSTTAVRSTTVVSAITAVYNAPVFPLLWKSRLRRHTHGSSRSMLSSVGMTFTTGPFQKAGVGPSLHFNGGAYRIASSQWFPLLTQQSGSA